MQMTLNTKPTTIDWMLLAKGLGIILVVAGHFNPPSAPVWLEIKKVIYSFHMPLFFFLSGFLYIHGKYTYRELIKNKANRLLYPFVSIALVFFTIKSLAGHIVNLQYPVGIHPMYTLLLNPVNSFAPLLWFVHALFLMFAVFPIARLVFNNLMVLLILLIINLTIGSDYLIIGKALENMPFFVIGVILRDNSKLSTLLFGCKWPHFLVPLAVFIFIYVTKPSNYIPLIHGFYFVRLLLGISGSIFIINLCHLISYYSYIKKWLDKIGYYSMSIYLLHPLFESSLVIGFQYLSTAIKMPAGIIGFTVIIAGVALPMLVEQKILRRYWLTKKFVLGLS